METLVLNASYEPLGRISWQRAMVLLFSDKVEIIEEYQDHEVRTVSLAFRMPSVVRFLSMIKRKSKGVKFSRENVFARDFGKCQYCKRRLPRHKATYDHVVPRSQGGKTRWDNIVIACIDCNQKKGDLTPEQARMKLTTKPYKPKSLPNAGRFAITYRKGMPESWKQFLIDVSYWHGEVEEE